jgi:HEAT repeat protein
MSSSRLATVIALFLVCPLPASAQSAPATPSRRDAADAAAIWTLLSEGQHDRAAQRAQQWLAARPRSAAALIAAVAATGAQRGGAAALGVYDRWLGSRTAEEPIVLRSVALMVLREEAEQSEDVAARGEAIGALTRAGERGDAAKDDPAVGDLIAQLGPDAGSARAMKAIDGLGGAGTPQALRALLTAADDPRTEIRGAVAGALGQFTSDEARTRLRQMLSDRVLWVRIRAAGSLLRLGDDSGVAMLQAAAAETIPSVRIEAASALASRPDAAWLALVRELSESSDLETRAGAAVLLAPHDPARAAEILAALQKNDNPAIRDLAQRSAQNAVGDSLTELRAAMRTASHATRAHAAARIVDLTR